MWFSYLLEGEAAAGKMPGWVLYVVMGVIIALLVGWFVFSGRKNKQRQKEYVEQLDAIDVGNKVKTAGGICGIVREVCDDNTVIIETGSEQTGKSFVKMDKELIAQTDAKGPTQIAREAAEAARKAEKEAKNPNKSQNSEKTEEKEEKSEHVEEPTVTEEPNKTEENEKEKE